MTLRSTFWATAEASATASEERVARAWRWELARWASRSNFPGDGRSFRNSHGNPAPSLARAPLFWRWGLARRASRNILALGSGRTGFPKQVSWNAKRGDVGRRRGRRGFKSMGQPMAVLSTIEGDPASGRNGRFILQKRLYGQIFRFRLRIADFTLSRTSSLSTARSRQKPGPGASRNIFRDAKNHRRFGLGSRRAARKLVPVVLTLGSGPSGFQRKLSARRPKLPRQPWQTRAFPKQLRGDGRSFRDSHGKPAPSFARAPLFWRWGLARRAFRNNFPGDGRSICDSVPRARFRPFSAGEWPDGLPETSFRATQASATAMANPRRRSRALRYCGAGGWPVGLPETIFEATAKASATASLAPASVVLALGSGRTGFPKQVSERCKAGGILDAAAAYAARSLCRNTGPGYQGRGPGQWPQWPFYQQADKWPDL